VAGVPSSYRAAKAVAAASFVGRLGFTKKSRKERGGVLGGFIRRGRAGIERKSPILVEIGFRFGSSNVYVKNSSDPS
jgi:hypothetical protein